MPETKRIEYVAGCGDIPLFRVRYRYLNLIQRIITSSGGSSSDEERSDCTGTGGGCEVSQ